MERDAAAVRKKIRNRQEAILRISASSWSALGAALANVVHTKALRPLD
jgi:hypothetical protein